MQVNKVRKEDNADKEQEEDLTVNQRERDRGMQGDIVSMQTEQE